MTARRPHWLPVALVLSLLSFPAFASPAAKPAPKPAPKPKAAAKGGSFFRLDKVKSTFSASCGFRMKGHEKGSIERRVILSSVPIDCAAADQEFDPIAFLESDIGEKKGAYASLTLSEDGSRIDGSWRSTEPSDGFSFGGQGEVQLTKNEEARVEGRYRTLKPESFFDKTFEFDLPLAVDLLSGSLSGEPLPKGGGDPGKAYQAYLKAVAKEDPAALQKVVTKERAEEIAQQVEGGLQKGDRAALDVEGKSFDGDKMRGQVFLVKEDGAWKFKEKRTRMVFD